MADATTRPGEFALIERYFRPLAADPGAFSLMDDAAVYEAPPGEVVVLKSDLIAENVHFLADDPPGSIARKALRVNLSDLAAKGATPVGYLLSVALPDSWTEAWIASFTQGLRDDQDRYDVTLFGGDTSRSADGLFISVAAIGRVPAGEMVLRSGAQPGDQIFVSGTIGDAALGHRLRTGGIDGQPAGEGAERLIDRLLHPQPRLALAPVLRRHATSAMDISDGLLGDFAHICEASGVTGEIEAALVPLSDPARALVFADSSALESVLTGGEDYEILATVNPASAVAFAADAEAAGITVSRIGRVVEGSGPPVVRGADHRKIVLSRAGHAHF